MSLEAIKAALNTTTGAQTIRQDLSSVISLSDSYPRPVLTNAPVIRATSTTHEWDEHPLSTAGKTVKANGGATFEEGGTPTSDQKTTVRKTNKTCRTGLLAQVTDTLSATWNGGGAYKLADGEAERLMAEAIDFATATAAIACKNQMEFMHIAGDSANSETLEGGQTDGLVKWAVAGGYVVATGGLTTSSVAMSEAFIKDGARGVGTSMASARPDTLLVAPELITDLDGYVANGAGRPIVTIAAGGDANGVTAGASVAFYRTSFGKLKIEEEPFLSPTYNSGLSYPAIIGYNKALVSHAQLIPFGAEPLARTGASAQRMVTCEYAQDHRVAKHTFVIQNVVSAVS